MKKFTLMIFAAVALISCQKDALDDSSEKEASAMNLTINVNKALSRAIEDGHPGDNDDKVSPKILSVTVISYNTAGTEVGVTDLSSDQIRLAVWGNYKEFQGGAWVTVTTPDKPSGAKIGLPKGTAKVDVVVNRAPLADYTPETNINYFNYRDNKNGDNAIYSYGDDNFDRVMLTTANYGKGSPLTGAVPGEAVPTYEMAFTVKPYLARLEVFGGIDVARPEVWTDGHGNMWKDASVGQYKAVSGEDSDTNGYYQYGAVKGTVANGFDTNTVYVPEYYWFRKSGVMDDPTVRIPANTFSTEGEVSTAGWVRQPYYDNAALIEVSWLPNRYYAVDVESIFVNNIKVKSIERTPYTHQWPGSAGATFWVDWYKSYHIGGWHKTGTSTGNTFLCLGNMWDRIAEANPGDYVEITIPEINGVSKMKIINGKALPIIGKSEYTTGTTGQGGRNIKIADGKAAAYVIYPQAKQDVTDVTDAAKLRHELPHIILKVKVYEDQGKYYSGTYIKGKEFITLSLFSDAASGAGNYITDFKGGNIYRFDLNELLYSFVGNVPVPGGVPTKDPIDPVDPDPEMPESQLTMTVKVLEWTIQNMFPVI